MDIKLSMVMPVYNAEDFLRESLMVPLKYVHEAIIVDGSPYGPSSDGTKSIIDELAEKYPGIIKYQAGTYINEDGSWNQTDQRNTALSAVTGNYVLQHESDIIYNEEDMEKIMDGIKRCYPRGILYFQLIEFWLNHENVRLYPKSNIFCFPNVGIIPVFSMDLEPYYKDGAQIQLKNRIVSNSVYIHNAFRYHYGWMGFRRQFEKHKRNVMGGLWGKPMEPYRKGPIEDLVRWIISHILDYPSYAYQLPFTGKVPDAMANRNPSFLDGFLETLDELEDEYQMSLAQFKMGG